MKQYEKIDYAGNAHLSMDQEGVSETDVAAIVKDEKKEISRSGSGTVVSLGKVDKDLGIRVVYSEPPAVPGIQSGPLNALVLGVSRQAPVAVD